MVDIQGRVVMLSNERIAAHDRMPSSTQARTAISSSGRYGVMLRIASAFSGRRVLRTVSKFVSFRSAFFSSFSNNLSMPGIQDNPPIPFAADHRLREFDELADRTTLWWLRINSVVWLASLRSK